MSFRESFLVRVWMDEACDPSQMRGEIEHVRSGQRRRFCGEEELLAILTSWTRALKGKTTPDTDDALLSYDIEESEWSM